jgi:hypothetical protein
MRYTKSLQSYLGILSVFALVVMGSGAYVWKSGQLSTSADTKAADTQVTIPVLNLVATANTLKVGESGSVSVTGDFSAQAATRLSVVISYPKDLIEVVAIDESQGILGQPTTQQIDSDHGQVKLDFSPLTGVNESGKIASFTFKTKAPGDGVFDFVPASSGVVATVLGTPTQAQADFESYGTLITIE